MQAPVFWQHNGLCAQILRPLGALTAALTARRAARVGLQLDIPVICVGNINAGGTGKTPTVIALIEMIGARNLTASGAGVFIVTRGYGGRLAGPILVNGHTAADVGDEPLLLSAFAPVIVAHDRAAGARLAQSLGAKMIVLDDGLQNPSLHKDFSIVVVDAAYGFGNGFCLPAGPLREPVAAGLLRADMVLSIGDTAAQQGFSAKWGREIAALPHIAGALQPLQMGMNWQGAKVIAFAGIGRPDKFFATLRAEGAVLLRTESLADHAPLPDALLSRLLAEARENGADLVTTEKDAARLPPRFRAEVLTLPVRLKLPSPNPLEFALGQLLAR
jgi:tetraacyldisaccharide 4'-kinase